MHPKSHTFGKGKNSVLNAKIFGLFTTFKFLFSIIVILFNLFFLLKSNKPIIKTRSKLYQTITTNGKNKVASIHDSLSQPVNEKDSIVHAKMHVLSRINHTQR